MELKPPKFECPTHHQDLTDLVMEALEDGPPMFYDIRAVPRTLRGTRKFKVIVTCPGAEPDAPAHTLTCTGTRS